ncbi:MAG: peptidoglycan DD-metalloendopeptidase family protein [Candidatus Manganitrophaceae bacterium]
MKKLGLASILFSMALYMAWGLLPNKNPSPLSERPIGTGEVDFEAARSVVAVSAVENKLVREHTLKAGDSLSGVLSVLGVAQEEILGILNAARKVYDLRTVLPGRKVTVFLEQAPQAVATFLYEIDPFRSLRIERSEGGFHAREEKTPLERELMSRQGTISDTLYDSARRSGVPAEAILDLSDIFAWDVDFSTEIQSGDRFQIVYEVFKKGDEVLRIGRVLAAELINSGTGYRAYYFSNGEGNGDYYDETGASLKKAFLKSPLRYRHISSGFTTRRFHPVLRVNRPHLGIDFAAPRGTPVMAASKGVVTQVGWNGGYGKTVTLRHGNGYSTLYGHLSRYEKGIRKGMRVEQGEVIGRVGSTGLSTGSHLHYTLMKHGRPINPKEADVVRGEPLPKTWETSFKQNVEEMNRHMVPSSLTLLSVAPLS